MLKYITLGEWVALAFATLVVLGSTMGCSGANFTALDPRGSGNDVVQVAPVAAGPEVAHEPEAAPAPAAIPENWPEIVGLGALREGATVPTSWGLKSEIPNDTFHSWAFEAAEDWSAADRAVLLRVTEQLNEETDWVISFDETAVPSTDVEVSFDASPPSGACAEGTGMCWFGQTGCLENESSLGAYRVCHRWYMNLSMNNITAWAFRKSTSAQVALETVFRHELGHSLGFAHNGDGIMATLMSSAQLRGEVGIEYSDCEKARLSVYTRFVGVDAQVTEVTPAACAR